LLKALIEAAQVRTTYVSAARDDLTAEEYSEAYRDKRRRQAERLLAERSSTRRLGSAAERAAHGIARNVAWLVERLQAAGVSEIIAVDLSKEDIGLPVVRVVIPGLEGPDDHDAYMPGERARRMSDGGP
jgi:ribosomal protein S12 methylthiotransferase accessory factor